MTLQQLKACVDFKKVGYGTWKIYRNFSRGRYATGITHNSLAIDRLSCDSPERTSINGYTLKQAYEVLLSCVVLSNVYRYV